MKKDISTHFFPNNFAGYGRVYILSMVFTMLTLIFQTHFKSVEDNILAGVFNSSKTTGSMSDADLTDDGSEGRVGVLDYFQPRSEIKTPPARNFGKRHQNIHCKSFYANSLNAKPK